MGSERRTAPSTAWTVASGGDVDTQIVGRLRSASWVASVALVALGATVLLGWLFDVPLLKGLSSTLATMKVNTALGFIVLGAALLLRRGDPRRARLIRALAFGVSGLGVVSVVENVVGVDLGIDELLVDDPASPGRMSTATAAHFVLLGLGVVLLDVAGPWEKLRASDVLACLTGLSSFIALLGYLYGVPALYSLTPYSSIALHTTVGFLGAAFAVLFAEPDRGFGRLLASPGPSGILSRRLLPAAILLPPAVGYLRLLGERAGLYDTEMGLALFATSNVVGFAALVAWTSSILLDADRERTAAEMEVREREEDLSTTLRSIGDAVIATDVSGRVTRMNPVAEALTGWTFDEARARSLDEVFRIIHEETRATVESPTHRVLREGVVVGLANHTVLISKDGTERVIADSGAPIRDSHGNIRGVVLVFHDQTEERRAERALERSEALKAAILNAALDCIVTIDHEGRIVEFNPAAEATFGWPREEVIGRLLGELIVPPRLRERHAAGLARYLATGENRILGRRLELPALRADGTELTVELAVVRIPFEGPPMFTAYMRDLRDRDQAKEATAQLRVESAERHRAEAALQRTEEQLRQAQKMEAIGRLAGGIAHDFNNLLAVVMGYATLLAGQLHESDPMHADVGEISRAATRASDLTRQILAFSRQQVLQPRVIDLNETISGMSRMLERIIGEDIELAVRTSPNLGRVRVDPGQIEQVLLNLVVNARDAMPEGGMLTIETMDADLDERHASEHVGVVPGPYVMLGVSDTGIGMDRETQARIFEPFFTTKERGRGTGLGLSTVFGIVAQSGGTVWVYSEPGKGATFKVYLPRAAELAALAVAPSAPSARRGTETILLVEDDEQLRKLARTVLESAGYRVVTASGGEEALRRCGEVGTRIDLLLTDVVMPKMSGPDLAERVAELFPGAKLLFMSGYADDAVVRHGVLESTDHFVQKPFMPDALLVKVRGVLDEPK